MAAQQKISCFFGEQSLLPFSPSPAGFPGTDKLESEVKEVTEESGKSSSAVAAPRTGSGSKRSRAAEVHNLSEKRRRSRINEKLRALQNLIPNSNKTDKASMLDEAIDYLKQLQLQVQMLSMRNGLSLHDMYLSGMVQPQPPLQAPEICMRFSGDNRIALNMGPGMLPLNHESLAQNQQVSSSHHSIILPIVTRLTVPQTSYGVESSQLPLTAEMLVEDMVLQHQLDAGPGERDPTDVVKATVPHFRGECSLLEDHGRLQIGILGREGTQNMLPRDSNHQFNIHHLDGLQPGRSIAGSDIKAESPEF